MNVHVYDSVYHYESLIATVIIWKSLESQLDKLSVLVSDIENWSWTLSTLLLQFLVS